MSDRPRLDSLPISFSITAIYEFETGTPFLVKIGSPFFILMLIPSKSLSVPLAQRDRKSVV